METALGIPFVKSPGVEGIDFDLLPRQGLNIASEIEAAKQYIHDTRHRVSIIRVTWLPQQSRMPLDHNRAPHFLVRVQNPSGGLNPFKRAIWSSFDFDEYNIKLSLYDGAPDPSNLLPEARITFSDGVEVYTVTGRQLFTMLSHNKLVDKKELK